MSAQPMFLVPTSAHDKRADKFARNSVPMSIATSFRRDVLAYSQAKALLQIDCWHLLTFTILIIMSDNGLTVLLIGLIFMSRLIIEHSMRAPLEIYEKYYRTKNMMIDQRRLVELPEVMFEAWIRAFSHLGITISHEEAAAEFTRLCGDPQARRSLLQQKHQLRIADCDDCLKQAEATMRQEMSALLRDRIADRQIDTRPGRLHM